MRKVTNYTISFISGKEERITKEQAQKIISAWASDAKLIIVNGNVYATHQIKSIERMSSSDEYFECLRAGVIDGDHRWPLENPKELNKFVKLQETLGLKGDKNVEYIENGQKQLGYKDPETEETIYS